MYDVSERRYITLQGIAQLVREGVKVEIIDNKSGNDITNQILAQVIVDENKMGRSLLSTENLVDVIRWGSRTVNGCIDTARQKVSSLIPSSSESNEIDELKERLGQLEEAVSSLASGKSRKRR